MAMAGKVKVGIIGSQFEADIHAASFRIMPEEAEVVAVASPTAGHPEALAEKYGILRFEGNAVGLVENSWARRGGMDDRIEVYGDGGVTYANLHMGNALPTFSEHG